MTAVRRDRASWPGRTLGILCVAVPPQVQQAARRPPGLSGVTLRDMTENFAGKTVLITGGGAGIGFATAQRLVAAGANVVLAGRDKDRLEAAAATLDAPDQVLVAPADVSSLADLDELYAKIAERFDSLDGVFANAGVGLNAAPEDVTEADFDQVSDINFKGVFFTVQKALPLLSEGGSIVLNASWLVHRGMSGGAVYAATKAAVRSLAQTLAPALAPRGIRVNTITPGHIETEMLRAVTGSDEVRAFFASQVPAGRLGAPDEIAGAVLFLLSSDAGYVTGQELIVDGGMISSVPG